MSKCENCIHNVICSADTYFKSIDDCEKHCCHFKDKSLFVELPCKVGDRVWCIDGYCDGSFSIFERTVMQFTVFKDRMKLMVKIPNYISWTKPYDVEQFGKTVFLTKEDAEKKLKEIE